MYLNGQNDILIHILPETLSATVHLLILTHLIYNESGESNMNHHLRKSENEPGEHDVKRDSQVPIYNVTDDLNEQQEDEEVVDGGQGPIEQSNFHQTQRKHKECNSD